MHHTTLIDVCRYNRGVSATTDVECCAPIAHPALRGEEADALARVFRALGDRHRVRIVNELASAGRALCVCELEPVLGLAQATVSHHLKQLVDAGLLERERRGTYAYYALVPGALDRVRATFARPRGSGPSRLESVASASGTAR
jgi:ArsR family transcriptional regulator